MEPKILTPINRKLLKKSTPCSARSMLSMSRPPRRFWKLSKTTTDYENHILNREQTSQGGYQTSGWQSYPFCLVSLSKAKIWLIWIWTETWPVTCAWQFCLFSSWRGELRSIVVEKKWIGSYLLGIIFIGICLSLRICFSLRLFVVSRVKITYYYFCTK